MARQEEGSAVVESVFAIFFLLFVVLGTIQVALSLYARNVVMAAVHDGARAAIEVGGSDLNATATARRVIQGSAGSLVDELAVVAETRVALDRYRVRVVATGLLDAPGPLPIRIPIEVAATTTREAIDVSGR